MAWRKLDIYCIWGALHGFYLVFALFALITEGKFKSYQAWNTDNPLASITIKINANTGNILHWSALGWIFFRAKNVDRPHFI